MRLDVADRIGHRAHELVHRRVAHVGTLLERLQHDLLDVRRHHAELRRRNRLLREVLDEDLAVALADERHAAGQHLVEHDAERVDVGAVIDACRGPRTAPGDMYAGVPSTMPVRVCATTSRRVAGELRDAEVEQLDEVAVAAALR